MKTQKQKREENNIKKLETLEDNPKQLIQHLKTLRGNLQSNSVDAIPPGHFSGTFQGTEHFSEENSTVNNNLLKATNPKCIRENSTLDSTFTVDEVSKGIARLKIKKQVVMIQLVMKWLPLSHLQFYLLWSQHYIRNKELPWGLVICNHYSNS